MRLLPVKILGMIRLVPVIVACILSSPACQPLSQLSQPRNTAVSTSLYKADVPFRQRPSMENIYRLRGVHYFQRGWPFTFWETLRPAYLDDDFASITSQGFNTVVLFLSWGKFQTRMNPETYDQEMFHKLETVIRAAKKRGLWVVIRVGTPEHVPIDLPDGGSYQIHDLLFDTLQIRALANLFAETSRRVERHDNVFGLFHSWEDFNYYLHIINLDQAKRLEYENRSGRFRTYLKERGGLEDWNKKWSTDYRSFNEIPVPGVSTRALVDYIDFIVDHTNSRVLPKFVASSKLELGYEPRLDKEPVTVDGSPGWYGYQKSYDLPANYTFIASYYNPFWGAPNDGGFITPQAASDNFRRQLDEIQASAPRLPIFVEQLNLADDTPAFTRTNSKLRYPHDEAEAVNLILPPLFRRTIGYSIWTFRDYVGNLIADGSFLARSSPWKISARRSYLADADNEKRLLLKPGMELNQAIHSYFNPGGVTNVPYRFDLNARVYQLGKNNPEQSIYVRIRSRSGREVNKQIRIAGNTARRYQVQFPELGNDQPVYLSVEADRTNRADLVIDDLRLWNHLMATGIVDEDGILRRSRSLAYRTLNEEWERFETGLAVPAANSVQQKCEVSSECPGAYDDRWIGRNAAVPLYVPYPSGTISLEYYIPETLSAAKGIKLYARWADAPRESLDHVFLLQPGLNQLKIPVLAGSSSPTPGDRLLLLRVDRTFRAPKDERELAFKVVEVGVEQLSRLELGVPVEGRKVVAISDPEANRFILKGHKVGDGSFRVYFHIRGHQPHIVDIRANGDWEVTLPLWKEYMHGKPELYLEVSKLEGSGELIVSSIGGESDRTPNPVYR